MKLKFSSNPFIQRFEEACVPGQEGEPNTINVCVTAAMSKEEVVEEVKKCVREMEENAKARLLDGYYRPIDNMFEHWEVQGDKIDLRDAFDSYDTRPVIEFGDYGGFNIYRNH